MLKKMPYYNKKGCKISIREWIELFKDNYVVIKEDSAEDLFISTEWIGYDEDFEKNGFSKIFKTTVKKYHSFNDLDSERYFTLEESKIGHKKMVKKWLKKGS